MGELIKLYTADGRLLGTLPVMENAVIYAMNDNHPEIIVWGQRFFQRIDVYSYREASMCVVLTLDLE